MGGRVSYDGRSPQDVVLSWGGEPPTQPPKPDPTLDDSSLEEDVHVADDCLSDSDFGEGDNDDSMDDGDEFNLYVYSHSSFASSTDIFLF